MKICTFSSSKIQMFDVLIFEKKILLLWQCYFFSIHSVFDLLRWQEGLTRYYPWSLWDFVGVEICNFKMFWWFRFCTVLVLRGCLFTNFVYSEIHSRYLKFASNNLLKLYNYNLFYISLFSRTIEIPQGKRYRMILVVFFLF